MAERENQLPSDPADEFFLRLENAAAASLLAEILTTPKPGLVDQEDNGAHRDMSLVTFIRSTGAVSPYFREMAETACFLGDDPEAVFPAVREIGKLAEKAMYEATGGVNTHKGMIFSIGLISAAAGLRYRTAREKPKEIISAEELLLLSGEIAGKAMNGDFARMSAPDAGMSASATHGELLFSRYGEQGIRGEAKEGFPVLREKALPMLRSCRARKVSENYADLDILLAVMSCLHDTNVVHRGSPEALRWLQGEARKILDSGGAEAPGGIIRLRVFNRECIRRNLSPGGSADMMAAALYLERLERLLSGGTEC
jgi:triphosphoribosyl-dephospho-CoA synthase CitG